MTADSSLWSTLIDLNKAADSLIDRARKRIEPSPPISRELLTDASIEVRFDNLPLSYDPTRNTVPTNSDALAGNNVKRGIWTNGASRLYFRELYFDFFLVGTNYNPVPNDGVSRLYFPAWEGLVTPPYFKWNYQTSITQKQYADKRVSMTAGGSRNAGNHLSFKDPLVLEPMETLTFEVELMSYGPSANRFSSYVLPSFVVGLYLSGYREGM